MANERTSRPSLALGPLDRGLDAQGNIRREGGLEHVGPAFADTVADLRARVRAAYGDRLDSLYLYGSVPRGTARIGESDLDALAVLTAVPDGDDRAVAAAIEAAVDRRHDVLDGVGLLVFSRDRILHPDERYDMGFFVACLCSPPLLGADLAARLPAYQPTVRLARDTNGDLATHLTRAKRRLDAAGDTADRTRLCRDLARKLVRTAFTLVMPRWRGWTSDFTTIGQVVGAYYPEQSTALVRAITWARAPTSDPTAISLLLDDFGPWLVAEYERTIGRKPQPTAG